MNLPKRIESPLYTVAEIRELESALFAEQDSFAVMHRAAQALFAVITADFPKPLQSYEKYSNKTGRTVHIVLGTGNNAGDGLVVGVLLKQAGFHVQAYTVFAREFRNDAKKAYDLAIVEQVSIQPFTPFSVNDHDIIIEAILGIGLDRPTEGNAKAAITHINACKSQHSSVTVYAVDNPAGILMESGARLGDAAVQADKTITFVGDKVGLHTADGKGCSGEVIIDTLGSQPQSIPVHLRYHYDTPQLSATHNAHKGDFGHALIIGGGQGMFGATALAAVSSLKVGTGKASIYSHSDYAAQFHLDGTPLYEVMRKNTLDDFSLYSSIILGVGLGRDNWGKSIFEQTLSAVEDGQSLLIDADGLWHLAERTSQSTISVITPHEAEASRLLGCTVEKIRQDKPHAVRALAQKYHCIAALKGVGTLISDGKTVWINESGNICLATAGTGDVLAGMIGGYLAQGFDALEATLYGVFRHGQAADQYLAQHGDKTLRASDLWYCL